MTDYNTGVEFWLDPEQAQPITITFPDIRERVLDVVGETLLRVMRFYEKPEEILGHVVFRLNNVYDHPCEIATGYQPRDAAIVDFVSGRFRPYREAEVENLVKWVKSYEC